MEKENKKPSITDTEIKTMMNSTPKGETLEELKAKCKLCDWSKHCVLPPSKTKEQVDKFIEDAGNPKEVNGKKVDGLMATMFATMLAGRDDIQVRNCEVFAQRLRLERGVTDKIKEMMQEKP